jgi:hypothetical protein
MPPNFAADLERGHATEQCILLLLNELPGVSCKSGPDDYTYDLSVEGQRRIHLLEVKDESNYCGSPNLCLELGQGAETRPSGLLTSEATLTLHVFKEQVWVYRTNNMRLLVRDLIDTGSLVVKPFRNGENFVRGVLLPTVWLESKDWVWFGALAVLDTCPLLDVGVL